MWEENLMAFTRVFGEACAGRDASRTHGGAVRCDCVA
jgi:hypothetical protein